MAKPLNLTNSRFGRLVAKRSVGQNKYGSILWECVCDCSALVIKNTRDLRSGNTRSCGCLNVELSTQRLKTIAGWNKLPLKEAARNTVYRQYQANANSRNIEFSLTVDELEKLTQQNCHYCTKQPNQICKNYNNVGDYVYNGIDRVNNDIGYILSNCVPSCGPCNRAKDAMTYNEFKLW